MTAWFRWVQTCLAPLPMLTITGEGRKIFYNRDWILSEVSFLKVFEKDECYLIPCFKSSNLNFLKVLLISSKAYSWRNTHRMLLFVRLFTGSPVQVG